MPDGTLVHIHKFTPKKSIHDFFNCDVNDWRFELQIYIRVLELLSLASGNESFKYENLFCDYQKANLEYRQKLMIDHVYLN